jgi:hypothetical protein
VTDRAQLKDLGDTDGLLALARAYRGGTQGLPKDMAQAFASYRDAAELGSAEAEFAVALFLMTGGVVSKDTKEATTRLRRAAELGSVPAKIYLGNLYEQGVYYARDAEKADVWYRSAARTAGIAAEAGTPEHLQSMADLGSIRALSALEAEGSVAPETMDRYRRKAKAHGLGVRAEADAPLSRQDAASAARGPTPVPPPAAASGPAAQATSAPGTAQKAAPGVDADAPTTAVPREPKADKPKANAAEPKADKPKADKPKADKPKAKSKPVLLKDARATMATTFGAFGYALLFLIAAYGVGYAVTALAHAGPVAGVSLPVTKEQIPWLLPGSLLLLGVLPQFFFYRAGAVLKSFASGLVLAGIGFLAWGTGKNMGQVLTLRIDQTLAFGVAGFVAVLFVLGFLGGARPKRADKRPSMTLFPDEDDDA